MRLALDAARAAEQHGDVPIGAVLLDASGRVLAVAGNERELTGDPTAHAEVLVLRRAGRGVDAALPDATVDLDAYATGVHAAASRRDWRFEDCTLVVTLEPCTMCAGAIVNARLGRVVFGAFDPKAGAVSSIRDVVRDPRLNHRAEVVPGVLETECAAALQDFFATRR